MRSSVVEAPIRSDKDLPAKTGLPNLSLINFVRETWRLFSHKKTVNTIKFILTRATCLLTQKKRWKPSGWLSCASVSAISRTGVGSLRKLRVLSRLQSQSVMIGNTVPQLYAWAKEGRCHGNYQYGHYGEYILPAFS